MTLAATKPARLDKKHTAALAQIVEAATRRPHGALTLDLRDPDHHLHLTRSFIGASKDKTHFPALARTLELTREAHRTDGGPRPFTLFEMDDPPTNVFQAAAKIQYCSAVGDPTAATVTILAGGVVTLLLKVSSITATMTVTDNNNGQATTINPVMKTSVWSIDVSISAVVTTPVNVTVIMTCLIVPIDNGPSASLVDTCVYQGASPVQSITVTAPVQLTTHPPRDYIKVGLGRTTDQVADLDYSYNFGVATVGVTVAGSATLNPQFSLAAATPFPGYLYLFLRNSLVGGGACIVLPIGTDMTQFVTNSGTSFTWNITQDTFQQAPWDQNQIIDIDFFMEYQVQPQGGGVAVEAQVRTTSIPQTLPGTFPDIAALLPLQFVWGCLPAGTRIRTETGERPIETVATGDRVFDGDGRLVDVTRTWTGWETTPFVRLRDERGGAIDLTTQHPVLTEQGMRLASELSPGAYLRTADGDYVQLAAVEQVPSDAKVFNLDLGTLEEVGEAGTTMVANGYVVGDNRAQGAQAREALERMLAEPEPASGPWALDLENSRRRTAGLPLVAALDDPA